MVSVASGGTADRIAARTLFKVLRAGSGTPVRYSSMLFGGFFGGLFGAPCPFAAEPRLPDFAFFMLALLQPGVPQQFLPVQGIGKERSPVASGEDCGNRARALSGFLPGLRLTWLPMLPHSTGSSFTRISVRETKLQAPSSSAT